MFKRGLVALSGDPIHNGHIDLVRESKTRAKEVLVAVANNDEKKNSYLFSLKERTDFARRALNGIDGVKVVNSPTEILSDTYLHFGCDALFRGIRDDKDQVYEETQMGYHKMIYPKLNPVYLSFRGRNTISSSAVKAFVQHHIDVAQHVPLFVKRALEEKISVQYKIGVTGGIAVGKSWVTNQLAKALDAFFLYNGKQLPGVYPRNHPSRLGRDWFGTAINFDDLIRSVYEDPATGPSEMRQQLDYLCLANGSMKSILNPNGTIDRPALSKFIFNTHPEMRLQVQELTQPFVDAKYREALHKAGPGIVVIEWAQLAEMQMGWLTNHNVIVVDSPDRPKFIEQRQISQEEFASKTRFQWTAEQKTQALVADASKDGEGHVIQFQNSLHDNKIESLVEETLKLFNLDKFRR